MNTLGRHVCTLLVGGLTFAGVALDSIAEPIVVDGVLDAGYGPPLATQTVESGFDDAQEGLVDSCGGSELDAAYATVDDGILYLMLPGNLESNFNKLELFFDSKPAGQNVLRADNANIDFDGLNAMAGLRFDTGFEADHVVMFSIGDNGAEGGYWIYANYAELLTDGGGPGTYLGRTRAASDGVLEGPGTNVYEFRLTLDNRNVVGVPYGCAASSGTGATTGMEIAIPLASIGYTEGPLKACAFINGFDHRYLSNQMMGPLPPGTCNPGGPGNWDLNAFAGEQFIVLDQIVPAHRTTWGQIKVIYR